MSVADDLSLDDKEEIMAWLKKHWVTEKTCPICTRNHWIVGGHIVTPTRMRNGGMDLGGTTYPQFMIVCGNCGFTHYFNAAVAKLRAVSANGKKEGGADGTS